MTRGRRRDVPHHLDGGPQRAVGLLRLRHHDARRRLRAVGRAHTLRRDQAGSGRELGVPRPADRGGSLDQPRGRGLRDQRLEEHHDRELSRLPRDPQLQPVPGGDPRLRIDGHPAAQRLGERRARLRRLRRQLRHEAAVGQVRLRQRRRGRDDRREVRERLFAVLDLGPAAAGVARPDQARRRSEGRGREARRRLPFDRGRGGGPGGHALLRRSPPAADLLVVAVAAPEDRARRAARRRQPRRRSVRERARALDGRAGRDGLRVPSRRPRDALTVLQPQPPGRARGRPPSCRRPSGPTASSAAISTWPPTYRRWPGCSPAR